MEQKNARNLNKERVKKHWEVFTPEWVVKSMMDLIPDLPIDATFFEPSFWNGNFLVEILKRKLEKCSTPHEVLVAVSSIYWVERQEDNRDIAISRLLDWVNIRFMVRWRRDAIVTILIATEILERNLVCGDTLTGKTHNGQQIEFPVYKWWKGRVDSVKIIPFIWGYERIEKMYKPIKS